MAGVIDRYVAEFEKLGRKDAARRRAIDRFAKLGFPTGAEEEWRFTDVTPIAEASFDREEVGAPFESEKVGSLAEGSAFAALNTALWTRGAHIRVPKQLETEIDLSGGTGVRFPRVLIEVEAGANAKIVERHASGGGFTNEVMEIHLGENATLDLTRIQQDAADAFHVSTVQVKQAPKSSFTCHSVTFGAAISRTDLGVVLAEGAECTLDGLYELDGAQLSDTHTTIDHAEPHGTSRERYKGILAGKSRGVFDGKIIVRPNAQKTNAMQTNRNLLLSDGALVNTKPQLEIHANDVKCKHGATIGKLDSDILFYLRSRGIGLEEARRLLIRAFACEVIDPIPIAAVRERILDLVRA